MNPLDSSPFAPKLLGDLFAGRRWLIDEDLAMVEARKLTLAGHDAISVAATRSLRGAPDPYLLRLARDEQRILVTADKGYGKLVFQLREPAPPGVILIRRKEEIAGVADLLMWLLAEHPIHGHFISVRGNEGRGQSLPMDRERARRIEEITADRPRNVFSFVVPQRLAVA